MGCKATGSGNTSDSISSYPNADITEGLLVGGLTNEQENFLGSITSSLTKISIASPQYSVSGIVDAVISSYV